MVKEQQASAPARGNAFNNFIFIILSTVAFAPAELACPLTSSLYGKVRYVRRKVPLSVCHFS